MVPCHFFSCYYCYFTHLPLYLLQLSLLKEAPSYISLISSLRPCHSLLYCSLTPLSWQWFHFHFLVADQSTEICELELT